MILAQAAVRAADKAWVSGRSLLEGPEGRLKTTPAQPSLTSSNLVIGGKCRHVFFLQGHKRISLPFEIP